MSFNLDYEVGAPGEYNSNGTGLQGYMEATYDQILKVLGPPTYKDEDTKVTCEWVIMFEDDVVATIYDWKEPETPKGLYEWHIGGRLPKVVSYIQSIFPNARASR
jgi:hypothetical protein